MTAFSGKNLSVFLNGEKIADISAGQPSVDVCNDGDHDWINRMALEASHLTSIEASKENSLCVGDTVTEDHPGGFKADYTVERMEPVDEKTTRYYLCNPRLSTTKTNL